MHTYTLLGVSVVFPFEAYPSQQVYMTRCVACLAFTGRRAGGRRPGGDGEGLSWWGPPRPGRKLPNLFLNHPSLAFRRGVSSPHLFLAHKTVLSSVIKCLLLCRCGRVKAGRKGVGRVILIIAESDSASATNM